MTQLTPLDPLRLWIADIGWAGGISMYIGLIVFASLFMTWLIRRVEKRLEAKVRLRRSLNLVSQFFVPVEIFFICAPLVAIVPRLVMPDPVQDVALVIAKIGTVAALVMMAMRAVDVFASAYCHQLKVEQPDNLKQRRLKTQVQFLVQFADVVIVFLGLAAVLLSFERFRSFGGSLLASAGLASVIVGFAAQKSLSNLIAGFQIAFTQPIRLGDAVLVENEWGTIEDITLTYVVVCIWDLRRLILPINYFLEKPFQNWTRTSASLIGNVMLYLDYSVPLDELRAELSRVLEGTHLWDGVVKNLQVVDTSERAIQVRILAGARNSGDAFELRCLIREKMIGFLQKNHPGALPKTRFDRSMIEDWAGQTRSQMEARREPSARASMHDQ